MDEPLSNLDANLRVQMRAEIKQLHKKLGTTFIYVTHDQTEALTMGDRIVVLDKGKIQQAETPERIYNNPKNRFVASFIGQMNFIPIEQHNGKFQIEGQEFELPSEVKEECVEIGIRSEKMIAGEKILNVQPEITEMLGGERIVYMKLNGSVCSAKVPLNYNIDESIELRISESDMYFFDKEGKNILYK